MSITACTGESVTPGVVVFDPTTFQTDFPAFASVSTNALTLNFNLATLMLNNSCCSVVEDAPTRAQLLNLLTAHITALLNGVNGSPPTGTVGRINNASQGSVSVQTEWAAQVGNSEAFFIQTQWGAMFWQTTLPYRLARYVPPLDEWNAWDSWPQ